jgi:ketosteroid isomerase-like protein
MSHPNVQRLRDGYTAFGKGDFAALDGLFAEDIRWHEPGRNQLSGDYEGRAAVYELFGRLMEVTEGSFRIDLRVVLADDTHGAAVVGITAHRGDRTLDTTNAHVFRFEGDRVAEFWETAGDQYATDEVLG